MIVPFDIEVQSFGMPQHTPPPAQRALARNLRRLRVARRWSLSELSGATGIGKATVSAIENGRANPTVDTLAALAGALEVELTALVEETPADDLTVVRSGQGAHAGDGFERVGRLAAGGEVTRAVLEPGGAVELAALPAGARLHVVVTRGSLVAGPSGRPVELSAGDYLSFRADQPHELNTARRAAEAVMVVERGSG
jgi:transcriptional regulator with XRE-family HTH domain